MDDFPSRIRAFLTDLPADRRRWLTDSLTGPAGKIVRDGRELLNFASNDYLGLAHRPEVMARAARWAEQYGAGLSASRLITGSHQAYQTLEAKLAELKGTESALIFQSGFQANASVLSALLSTKLHGADSRNAGVQVFSDRLNHASMHFGISAAGVKQIRYRHNDLQHLDERLHDHAERTSAKLIATESIFSMDGDQVDVGRIREIAARHNAFLYVDEAHATGVAGHQGMGLFAEPNEKSERPAELILGTFSKALGSFGAYVACSQAVRDYLIQTSPGFIYSTALPPAVLGAIDAALEIVPTMDGQRLQLRRITEQLRDGLNAAGYDTLGSTTQIIPVAIESDARVMRMAKQLEARGFLVGAIRPPTVPVGGSRLRISLSAAHSEDDVARLLAAIVEVAGQ